MQKYEKPTMNIDVFKAEDIVRTSSWDEKDEGDGETSPYEVDF